MKSAETTQAGHCTPFQGRELRRHKRHSFSWPVKICPLESSSQTKKEKPSFTAKIKNISKGGIKISLLTALEKDSHTLLILDLSKLDAYLDRNNLLKISDNRILAQVVWRKLNLNTGLFEAGLKFIEESEREDFGHVIELTAGL